MFADGEMAETLREITKIDPSFDQDEFLLHCEKNVIPAVLEVRFAGHAKELNCTATNNPPPPLFPGLSCWRQGNAQGLVC